MSDAEIITQARIQLMRGTDPTDVADYILDALTERSWHAPSRVTRPRRGDGMTAAAIVPAQCPNCGRLTVDNRQHCPDMPASQWARVCLAMTCAKCGTGYHTHTTKETQS